MLQSKNKVNISPIFYLVLAIIAVNIIVAFPILIIFILIFLFNGKINLEKVINNTWVNKFLKKQFWANYDKIIAEIKKSKEYQQRVKRNRNKRDKVEHLFTDHNGRDIDENFERTSEQKFIKMQKELENKKQKERIFYQQNKQTLQDKFAQQSKIKKTVKNDTPSWRDAVTKTDKKSHKNFFWNNKKASSFGEGKSIWDNYESVTERFSSNKK